MTPHTHFNAPHESCNMHKRCWDMPHTDIIAWHTALHVKRTHNTPPQLICNYPRVCNNTPQTA